MRSLKGAGRSRLAILGLVVLFAAPLLAVALPAGTAGATTVGDEASFRAAWNTDAQIDLSADITLTCAGGASAATRNTGSNFTLDGHAHTITQTCGGNGVLDIEHAYTSGVVKNVTITGGTNSATPDGAGLLSNKSTASQHLLLQNVAVINNMQCGSGDGGGVDWESTTGNSLQIVGSTIANNSAVGNGGGMWANGGGSVTIQNSTIANNTAAGDQGAFRSNDSPVNLVYSTIARNQIAAVVCTTSLQQHAAAPPGHHDVDAQAALHVQVGAGTLTAFATVVALPQNSQNCLIGVGGTTSQGYNFSDDATCTFMGTGDHQSGDPALGALANNPPTTVTMPPPVRQTLLPQTGSPLIDAIPTASCSTGLASTLSPLTDERSVPRPQGAGCEIGAVEIEVPVAVIVAPRFTG